MVKGGLPGDEAVKVKGWLKAHQMLVLRRIVQLGILGTFMLGPLIGVWIVKGNLASSLTLEILPLTDPMLALQTVLTGNIPMISGIVGVIIVTVFYMLVGGRVYCAWVCPVNMITDMANGLRRKLKIKGGMSLSRQLRFWLLLAIFILTLLTGTLVWELINPVSVIYRGILFGFGMAWVVVMGIFLLDLFVAHNAWCGHLCPVGAFYSLLGHFSVLRVSALKRDHCDDCMDCFTVCPESKVIKPALKGAEKQISPVILSGQCNNCGRCIDVCAKDVFTYASRFSGQK